VFCGRREEEEEGVVISKREREREKRKRKRSLSFLLEEEVLAGTPTLFFVGKYSKSSSFSRR